MALKSHTNMNKIIIIGLVITFATGPVAQAQVLEMSEQAPKSEEVSQNVSLVEEKTQKTHETEAHETEAADTKSDEVSDSSESIDSTDVKQIADEVVIDTTPQDMSILFREGISSAEFDAYIQKIGEDRVWSIFDKQGFNAKLTEADAADLRADKNIFSVDPVTIIKTSLNDVVNIIDANDAWAKQVGSAHLDGEGQTVCVLDTGVDFTHESLSASNILGFNLDCYNGNCINNGVTVSNGHGTHVAGIIAGSGAIRGVAPGANIISLKVFNGGSSSLDSTVPIQNAINWCRTHADQYNISVISISLGGAVLNEQPCDNIQGFAQVVNEINAASNANISVVAASGNGARDTSVDFPACVNRAIAVAATNKNDTFAGYSNMGALVKLFAPGTNVMSTWLQDGAEIQSGTSMAAPAVSAAIAILNQYNQATLEAARTQSPESLENRLFMTGFEFDPELNARRINVNDALLSVDRVAPLITTTLGTPTSTPLGHEVLFSCDATDWQLATVSMSIVYIPKNRPAFHKTIPATSATSTQFSRLFKTTRRGTYSFSCSSTDAVGNVRTSAPQFVTL